MFEDVVSYFLSKYLGQYVENINREAIRVSLWKGDIELEDLVIKSDALNDLRLPIQVKCGYFGKMKLHFPWGDITSSPSIIVIEDIYALVVPNREIQYDPLKELERNRERKQKELKAIEEQNNTKTVEEGDKGFIACLFTNILSNLKITINRVHIRYEDTTSHVGHPFTCGIVLESLDLYNTPTTTNLGEAITSAIFEKIIKINGFGLYFNTDNNFQIRFNKSSEFKEDMSVVFNSSIEPGKFIPQYIIQPIFATLNLLYNEKTRNQKLMTPKELISMACIELRWDENDTLISRLSTEWIKSATANKDNVENILQNYQLLLQKYNNIDIEKAILLHNTAIKYNQESSPIITINFVLPDVTISINKNQYNSTIAFISQISNNRKIAKYRQFKPNNKENMKLWWQYACNCIMFDIRENKKVDTWTKTIEKLKYQHYYIELYKLKLRYVNGCMPVPTEIITRLIDVETELTIPEILFFRKTGEYEYNKQNNNNNNNNKSTTEEKEEGEEKEEDTAKPKESQSYLSWLFSRGPSPSPSSAEWKPIDPEELYESIHYNPNEKSPWEMAKESDIITLLRFSLQSFHINLLDQSNSTIMKHHLDVFTSLNYYNIIDPINIENYPSVMCPTSNSFKGLFLNSYFNIPIPFEKNTVITLKMQTEPIQVIFDLPLLYKIIEFFSPEKSISYETIESTIMNSLNISQVVDNHFGYNLDITIKSCRLLIPPTMLVSETSSTTQYICSLENIKINSNPKNLPEIIPTDEKSLDLYDEFSIKINNISTEFYSQTELYDIKRNKNKMIYPFNIELNYNHLMIPALPQFSTHILSIELSPCVIDINSVDYFSLLNLITNVINYHLLFQSKHNNNNNNKASNQNQLENIHNLAKPNLILPFQCNLCHNRFASRKALKSHIWRVHNVDIHNRKLINSYINNNKTKTNENDSINNDNNSNNNKNYENSSLKQFQNKINILISPEYFEMYQKKIIFESTLKWSEMKLNICKEEQKLYTIILNNYEGRIEARKFDFTFDTVLHSLDIIDNYRMNISNCNEPLYIIQSTDTYKIRISHCEIGSANYSEDNENILIQTQLGCISMYLNKAIFSNIRELFLTSESEYREGRNSTLPSKDLLLPPPQQQEQQQSHLKEKEKEKQKEEEEIEKDIPIENNNIVLESDNYNKKNKLSFKFSYSLESLSLYCQSSKVANKNLCLLTIHQPILDFKTSEYGFIISGSLQSILFYDLRKKSENPLVEMGTEDSVTFITYNIKIYENKSSKDYPGYPTDINIQLNNIKFVCDFQCIYFVYRYIMEIVNIFRNNNNNIEVIEDEEEGIGGGERNEEIGKIKKIPEKKKKKEFSHLNITLSKIKFILPENENTIESSYIESNIESIIIYNKIDNPNKGLFKQLARVIIETNDVSSCTYSLNKNEINQSLIVNNYSYTAELTFYDNIYITLNITDIILSIDPIQINFLFNMYDKNLTYFFQIFSDPSKKEELIGIENMNASFRRSITDSQSSLLTTNSQHSHNSPSPPSSPDFTAQTLPPSLNKPLKCRTISFTVVVNKIALDIYRTANVYLYSTTITSNSTNAANNNKNNSEPLCRFVIDNFLMVFEYYKSIFNFYFQVNSLQCIDIRSNTNNIVEEAKNIISFINNNNDQNNNNNNNALVVILKKKKNYYDIDFAINNIQLCPTVIVFDIIKWIKVDIPIISKNSQSSSSNKIYNINYHINNSMLYIIADTYKQNSKTFRLCFSLIGNSNPSKTIYKESEYLFFCHYAKIEAINIDHSYYILSPVQIKIRTSNSLIDNESLWNISFEKVLKLTLSYSNMIQLKNIVDNFLSLYSNYVSSLQQFIINQTKSLTKMNINLKDGLSLDLIHRQNQKDIIPLFQFAFSDVDVKIEQFSNYLIEYNLSASYYNQSLSIFEPMIENFKSIIKYNIVTEDGTKYHDFILTSLKTLNINITIGLAYTLTIFYDTIKNNPNQSLNINHTEIIIQNYMDYPIEIFVPNPLLLNSEEMMMLRDNNNNNSELTSLTCITINKYINGYIQYNRKKKEFIIKSHSNHEITSLIGIKPKIYENIENSIIFYEKKTILNNNNEKKEEKKDKKIIMKKHLIRFLSTVDFNIYKEYIINPNNNNNNNNSFSPLLSSPQSLDDSDSLDSSFHQVESNHSITIDPCDEYEINNSIFYNYNLINNNNNKRSSNIIKFRIADEDLKNINIDKCGYSFYNIYINQSHNIILDTNIKDKIKYVIFRPLLEISNQLNTFITIICDDEISIEPFTKTIDVNESTYIPDNYIANGNIQIITEYGDANIKISNVIGNEDINKAKNVVRCIPLYNNKYKISCYIVLNSIVTHNPSKYNQNTLITLLKFEIYPQFSIHNNLLYNIHYILYDSDNKVLVSRELNSNVEESVMLPLDISVMNCNLAVIRSDCFVQSERVHDETNLFILYPDVGRIKVTNYSTINNYISYTVEETNHFTYILHIYNDIIFINNSGIDLWCAIASNPKDTEILSLPTNQFVIKTKEEENRDNNEEENDEENDEEEMNNNNINNNINNNYIDHKIAFSFPINYDSTSTLTGISNNKLYFAVNPTIHKWSYEYNYQTIGVAYYDIVIDGNTNEQLILINKYYKQLFKYSYVLEIKSKYYIYNLSNEILAFKQYNSKQKPIIIEPHDNKPFNWLENDIIHFIQFKPLIKHRDFNWTERMRIYTPSLPICVSSRDETENLYFNISRTRFKYSQIFIVEPLELPKSNYKIINSTINFYIQMYQIECGSLQTYTILPLESQGIALINPLKDLFILTFIPYIIEDNDIQLNNYTKGHSVSLLISLSEMKDKITIHFSGFDIKITKENNENVNINNRILVITDNYLEKYEISISKYIFSLFKFNSIYRENLNSLKIDESNDKCDYILFHILYSYGLIDKSSYYEFNIKSEYELKTVTTKYKTMNPTFDNIIIMTLSDKFSFSLFKKSDFSKDLLGSSTLETGILSPFECENRIIKLSSNLALEMNIVKAGSKKECEDLLMKYYYKRNLEYINHNILINNDLTFYNNCINKKDLTMKVKIEKCNIHGNNYRGFYIVLVTDKNTVISSNPLYLESDDYMIENVYDNIEQKSMLIHIENSGSIAIEYINDNYYLTVISIEYRNLYRRNLIGSQVIEINKKPVGLYKNEEIQKLLSYNINLTLLLIPNENSFSDSIEINEIYIIEPQIQHNTYYKLFIYGIPFMRTEARLTGKYMNINGDIESTSLQNLGQKSIYDVLICGKEVKYNTNVSSYDVLLDCLENISVTLSFQYDTNQSNILSTIKNYNVSINELGISFISNEGVDILYYDISHLNFLYQSNSKTGYTVEFSANSLQIDNKNINTIYPILLFPNRKEGEIHKNAFYIDIKGNKRNVFDFIHIYLEPCVMKMHSNLLAILNKQYQLFSSYISYTTNQIPETIQSYIVLDLESERKDKIFINNLTISELSMELTFSVNPETLADLIHQYQDLLLNFSWIADVDQTLLEIDGYEMKESITSYRLLFEDLKHYYKSNIYNTLSATILLDKLGNPIGFVRSIGNAAMKIFESNNNNSFIDPGEFGDRLISNTKSIAQTAGEGILHSAGRITTTLGSISKAISLDNSKSQLHNNTSHNIESGLRNGFDSLISGVIKGATGIIKDPIKGFKENGTKGLMKGIATGVAGVVARPISGVFDGATHTITGVKNTIFKRYEPQPVRLARYFDSTGIVYQYNERDALANYLINIHKLTRDIYLWCTYYNSNKSILYISTSYLTSFNSKTYEMEWIEDFNSITYRFSPYMLELYSHSHRHHSSHHRKRSPSSESRTSSESRSRSPIRKKSRKDNHSPKETPSPPKELQKTPPISPKHIKNTPPPPPPLPQKDEEENPVKQEPIKEEPEKPLPAKFTRSGMAAGVYIPPHRLAQMRLSEDKSSVEYQRMTWDALRKSINGVINKVNISNITTIIAELFQENLVRGRGLLARALMKAQLASPGFTHVYAALISVVNTKLPENGELLVKRVVFQFRKAFKRNDKIVATGLVMFIAHLVNQQVVHELLALQIIELLLSKPTNDSVEVAISFVKECGQMLEEVSPKGFNAVFERFKGILHEGDIDKRVQYTIEGLFAVRKSKFRDYPAVHPDLQLVESEDQITHEISLDEKIDKEDHLDVFHPDPHFVENEELWNKIKEEIIGSENNDNSDNSDGEEGEGDGGDSESGSDDSDDEDKKTVEIEDLSEQDLVNLRRTVYLTIMNSVGYEECVHKLLKINLKEGEEYHLCNMIVESCAQDKSYNRFYGLIAQRLCLVHSKWQVEFEKTFEEQYATIHRLDTNKLRNISKFYSHLLYTDSMPWTVFEFIHLNEDETTSASRIFIKFLLLDLVENLGLEKVKERFFDPCMTETFSGLFPADTPKNIRFAINFLTQIGLGELTDHLRESLK